jgi:hypothetical protein
LIILILILLLVGGVYLLKRKQVGRRR